MAFVPQIATGSSVPIYRQIAHQVAQAISAGALRADEALPSVRGLAELLVINPNTVARAYSDLIRDGLIEARAGKGVFVARRRVIYAGQERRRRLDDVARLLVNEAALVGAEADEVRDAVERQIRGINLSAGAGRPEGARSGQEQQALSQPGPPQADAPPKLTRRPGLSQRDLRQQDGDA